MDSESREEVANDSLCFAKYFKLKMNKLRLNEIISSTRQGVNLAQRIKDE